MKTKLTRSQQFSGLLIYAVEILACFALSDSVYAAGEDSFEVTCRAKAKKVAMEVYSGCIAEEKQQVVEGLKSQYKDELRELKKKYDYKIKKVNEELLVVDESDSSEQVNAPVPLKDGELGKSVNDDQEIAPQLQNQAQPQSQPEAKASPEKSSRSAVSNERLHKNAKIAKALPKKGTSARLIKNKIASQDSSPVVVYDLKDESSPK